MDLTQLPGLIAIFVGLTVFFALYSIFSPLNPVTPRRVDENYEGAQVDFVPTDSVGRYVRPILTNFMPQLPKGFLVASRSRSLRNLIVKSGNPWKLTAEEFVAIQVAFAVVGIIAGTVVALLNVLPSYVPAPAVILAMAVAGYVIPYSKYNSDKQARTKAIQRELPEALDLLTVTLDAGSTFEPALRNVTSQLQDGLLRTEFSRIGLEIMAGQSMELALTSLYMNIESEDAESFVRAVIQAQRLGADVSETLKRQADYVRSTYQARIERMIARLSTTMFIPLIGTMVPALLLCFLAPALSRILTSIGGS